MHQVCVLQMLGSNTTNTKQQLKVPCKLGGPNGSEWTAMKPL